MILVILRMLVGAIFLVSGFEKALSPSGNFLYVIQSYQVIPLSLGKIAVAVFPWVEIILGAFLILGLWLRQACMGVLLVSFTFIVVVAQALIRRLPLDDCGCFGDLVHLLPSQVIFLDFTIFTIMTFCLANIPKVSQFSLDRLFEPKEQ